MLASSLFPAPLGKTLQCSSNLDQHYKILWWFSVWPFLLKHFTIMGHNTLTKVTVVNFPPKKYPRPICPPKLLSPVFCDGHVHKYQTQLCILTKLKKRFLWITSVCLNFRYSNSSHCRKPWLCKYLLHRHLQIFMQGTVFVLKRK